MSNSFICKKCVFLPIRNFEITIVKIRPNDFSNTILFIRETTETFFLKNKNIRDKY